MTRKQLQQAFFLIKRIEDLENQKRQIEVSGIMQGVSYNGMPHGSNVSTPVEDIVLKVRALDEDIENLELGARESMREIMKYVAEISQTDVYLAEIVRKRCLDMLSWRKVAEYFGEGYTDEAVRKYYERKIPWN